MYDGNAKSQNYEQLILNMSVKKTQNFVLKYCLTAELLIFKYHWQNILVSNTAFLSSLCGWHQTPSTLGFLLRILTGEQFDEFQADLPGLTELTITVQHNKVLTHSDCLPPFAAMLLLTGAAYVNFSKQVLEAWHCSQLVRKFCDKFFQHRILSPASAI